MGGSRTDGTEGTGDSGDDALATHWSRIRAGAARVQQYTDHALTEAGVPPQWFPVLHLLLVTPEHRLPMSTLARDALMTSGGFTKLADRMARDGIIDRRGSPTDRRVIHAALTPAGLELARRAARVHADALRAALGNSVDPQELDAAAQVMSRLGADAPAPVVDAPPAESTGSDTSPSRPRPALGNLPRTARDPVLPERRGRGRERE